MEIVALKQKVDDNINKIIAKFVCCHHTAKLINTCIKYHTRFVDWTGFEWDFLKYNFFNHMHWKYCKNCHHEMELKRIRNCGGRCPHCDVHWYDFNDEELCEVKMQYKWRDSTKWRDYERLKAIEASYSD